MRPRLVALAFLLLLPPALVRAQGDWVASMKKVHARHKGTKGTFALFGDSISVSLAFWAGLPGKRTNLDKEGQAAFELVNKRIHPDCWRGWRGPAYGNNGGMTVRWAHDNVDAWLKKLDPETALIMFGTNDLGGVPVEEYEKKLRIVVQKCLDNGTVVLLSTIPPRSGLLERCKSFNDAVRRVARDTKVPLCDYFAECLKRRPDDWDGALPKFAEYKDYDVPTIIARDGVHPSAPARYNGDYSDEALRSHGYNLRSYLALTHYARIIRSVYNAKE